MGLGPHLREEGGASRPGAGRPAMGLGPHLREEGGASRPGKQRCDTMPAMSRVPRVTRKHLFAAP
jgi:hypothetical protein